MFDFGDRDWDLFKEKMRAATSVRLDDYKAEQMRRRVATMAQRAGAPSFATYFALMQGDPAAMTDFLDRFTINVSELFRNPERFTELQGVVLPRMLSERRRTAGAPLRVWSAGCSYGAEAYSLAILLDEMRLGSPWRVTATDIDRRILGRAREGRFQTSELQNISAARLAAYFRQVGDGEYAAIERLRRRISFHEHDLLSGPFLVETCDLVVCRNVVIYFTDQAKERVFAELWATLAPGGVLFIGSTERLPDHRALGFEMMMPFFYRKPLESGGAKSDGPSCIVLPRAA